MKTSAPEVYDEIVLRAQSVVRSERAAGSKRGEMPILCR